MEMNMVRLENINQSIFKVKRLNEEEEKLRLFIYSKIKVAKAQKYEKFSWFLPEIEDSRLYKISELISIAKKNNGHIATSMELGLIWADLIDREILSWHEFVKERDVSEKYRLIKFKEGYKIVGGATKNGCFNTTRTDISKVNYAKDDLIPCTVPIIVIP